MPLLETSSGHVIELVIQQRRRDLGSFEVGRVLPYATRRMVGPYIFFDRIGPKDLQPGLPREADIRPHPHIGLSTITYLFDGEIMHRDSVGSEQAVRPGEVNWMTSGSGITHSERFEHLRREGGRLDGIQAWVALPDEHEDMNPEFWHYDSAALPVFDSDGVVGRLIAGRLLARLDRMRDAPGLADCAVSMVFMQRAGHGRQRPVAQPLLPLDPDLADGFAHRRWQSSSLPFSRLDPAVLLSALLRSYLFSGLYRAAAEAMVTENAARLARMQQAERAVDDRLEMLNADLRALRQSEITTGLLDVIIGFEALRKRNARRPARIGATGGDAHV